jgi:hypothetical protein
LAHKTRPDHYVRDPAHDLQLCLWKFHG